MARGFSGPEGGFHRGRDRQENQRGQAEHDAGRHRRLPSSSVRSVRSVNGDFRHLPIILLFQIDDFMEGPGLCSTWLRSIDFPPAMQS